MAHTKNQPKKNSVPYPTLEEIKTAGVHQIKSWYNGSIPSPDMKNDSQVAAMKAIIKRHQIIRRFEAQNNS